MESNSPVFRKKRKILMFPFLWYQSTVSSFHRLSKIFRVFAHSGCPILPYGMAQRRAPHPQAPPVPPGAPWSHPHWHLERSGDLTSRYSNCSGKVTAFLTRTHTHIYIYIYILIYMLSPPPPTTPLNPPSASLYFTSRYTERGWSHHRVDPAAAASFLLTWGLTLQGKLPRRTNRW